MKATTTIAFALLAAVALGARLRSNGPAPGPAPAGDNLQEELLDQADPEFKLVSGGDDCIDMKEFEKFSDQEVDMYAEEKVGTTISTFNKEERDELRKEASKHASEMFKAADKNKDGCIDEKEWNGPEPPKPAAPGPAPAVQGPPTLESMAEGDDRIGSPAPSPHPIEVPTKFQLMDINGDGRISRSEAYTYVADYMDEADLNSNKMLDIFTDADADKDNYISEEEFEMAGTRHKGDGKFKFFTLAKPQPLKHIVKLWDAAARESILGQAAGPAPGPVPLGDNLADELLDQADPEFDKMSGGDDCIDIDDLKKTVDQEVDMYGQEKVGTTISTYTKEERDAMRKDADKYAEEMFKATDANKDGCIDKKEWDGPVADARAVPGPAPQGPPTGESLAEGDDRIGSPSPAPSKKPFDTETKFKMMDINGDGRISRSEAYTYVADYMPQADLNSNKMRDIFMDADVDKDNYISEEEFEMAGIRHQGDGKFKLYSVAPQHIKKLLNLWEKKLPKK